MRKIKEKPRQLPHKSCRKQISEPHQHSSYSLSPITCLQPHQAAQGLLICMARKERWPKPRHGHLSLRTLLISSPYTTPTYCTSVDAPQLYAKVQEVGFGCWGVAYSQERLNREDGRILLAKWSLRPSAGLDWTGPLDLQISSISFTFLYQQTISWELSFFSIPLIQKTQKLWTSCEDFIRKRLISSWSPTYSLPLWHMKWSSLFCLNFLHSWEEIMDHPLVS